MWFGGDAIMAIVMVGLAIGCMRTIDSAPVEHGWLEQARTATFAAHTGGRDADTDTDTDTDIDTDDDARTAYNDWLARLDQRRR